MLGVCFSSGPVTITSGRHSQGSCCWHRRVQASVDDLLPPGGKLPELARIRVCQYYYLSDTETAFPTMLHATVIAVFKNRASLWDCSTCMHVHTAHARVRVSVSACPHWTLPAARGINQVHFLCVCALLPFAQRRRFVPVLANYCEHIVQELCESRGGRPGLSVLTSLTVSVDVKQY